MRWVIPIVLSSSLRAASGRAGATPPQGFKLTLPKEVSHIFRNWASYLDQRPYTRGRLLKAVIVAGRAPDEDDDLLESPSEIAARVELLAALGGSSLTLPRPAVVVFYDGPIGDSFARYIASITDQDRDNYRVSPGVNRSAKRDFYMVLRTPGGNPDAAYVAMRYLQRTFREVHIAVAERASSAGTLFLLGAHRVHMGPVSVLGPLDAQVPLLHYLGEDYTLHERSDRNGSIEEIMSGFQEILRLRAKDLSTSGADWWSQYLISSGITADVVGACLRLRQHVQSLAVRLLFPTKKDLPFTPEDVARQLVYGYDDHGFGLDPCEAKGLLGTKVSVNSPLSRVADSLVEGLDFARAQSDAPVHTVVFDYDASLPLGRSASYADLCAAYEATRAIPMFAPGADDAEQPDDDDDEDDDLDEDGEE